MFRRFRTHLSWKELLRRTLAESQRDDVMGLAAQLSFYLVLAVFPTLVCLIAVASLFPLQDLTDETTRLLAPILPGAALSLIEDFMMRIGESRDTGLLSLGLALAIWSASTPLVALANVMNRAYGITDTRPWWRVRLTAIGLSIGLTVFILLSFTLVLFGPQTADLLARWFGFGQVFVWTWKIVQWPVVVGLVVLALTLIYHFAPDAEQDWVWITPGSIMAALLWLLGSLGFRYYAVNFGSYEATYGAIGGMMLLLMWFWVSSIALIVGAELNAEVERAAPWSSLTPLRPGERAKIGAAAERAWRARQAESNPTDGGPPQS